MLLPEYATGQSAGMDIRANLDEPIVLKPLQRCLVPTGLYIALPEGFEAQIRPRSGLAIKKGIGVLNSPGTIDADYRGEICIILVNLSSEDFMIEDGERIAQMVVARHEHAEWQEVEVLDETPILTAEQLRLAAWMRERLYCTYFDCVHAMLPAGLWFKRNETYTLARTRIWRLCGSGTAKTVRCWRCLSSRDRRSR